MDERHLRFTAKIDAGIDVDVRTHNIKLVSLLNDNVKDAKMFLRSPTRTDIWLPKTTENKDIAPIC